MRPLQVLREQVQILHGCGNFCVPEDDRQTHDIAAVSEVLSRERVAE